MGVCFGSTVLLSFKAKKIMHWRTDNLISIQVVPYHATYYLGKPRQRKLLSLFFGLLVTCQCTVSCKRYQKIVSQCWHFLENSFCAFGDLIADFQYQKGTYRKGIGQGGMASSSTRVDSDWILRIKLL